MTLDKSFSWLGRFPLAVDVADTVRVAGSEQVDLLADESDLSTWISFERPRFPEAEAARGHLAEFRPLRNAVRDLLLARAGGRELPGSALSAINRVSARAPAFPVLTVTGGAASSELNPESFDVFCALVARSTVEVISGPERDRLAVCRAPSCGMPFVRGHGRQRWCSSACGNRARVARHTARISAQTE